MKKVKLIWDFKGSDTHKMATHYNKHLIEFFESKSIQLFESGVDAVNDFHHLAYAVVREMDVNQVKHPLKPHRAFLIKN